jgi:NAD(P)-dependent dehydrogenase (short-subunit alcohol dehydrogenase family)
VLNRNVWLHYGFVANLCKGIAGKNEFLQDTLDTNGNLIEPDYKVLDVNFTSVFNTVKLATYYLKNQEGGGSIVLTASGSSECYIEVEMVDSRI